MSPAISQLNHIAYYGQALGAELEAADRERATCKGSLETLPALQAIFSVHRESREHQYCVSVHVTENCQAK